TSGSTTGTLTVQLLVPYSSNSFADNATFQFDGGTAHPISTADVSEEIVIPGPDGVSPAYRLVTFTTWQNFRLDDGLNNIVLTVTYAYDGSYTASKQVRFSFLPDRTVIQNMYLLPDFDPAVNNNVSNQTKTPLNGVQVNSA